MVLHHNATPADLISDCAKLLTPNGTMMVTELCEHGQEWVKASCGDIWLGFSPESLTRWASSAGLVDSNSIYIAQRNGFRIQIRQFNLANS
jgi:ArsR family transcriptional regulator